MSLSDILFMYRARLSARAVLVQEGFAVLGIAVGVALLFASQVASTSLTRSVADLTSELVGDTQLQIDARGPAGFRERLLAEIRGLRGVQAALPVLEQQANVIGPGGQRSVDLIGADPRFARFGGSLLQRFSARQLAAQRVIALPAPIARRDRSRAFAGGEAPDRRKFVEALLGATLSEAEIGGLVQQSDRGGADRLCAAAERPAGEDQPRSTSGTARAHHGGAGRASAARQARRREPGAGHVRLDAVSGGVDPGEIRARRCSPRSARSSASCSRSTRCSSQCRCVAS